jgi:hypothetical protein
MTVYRGVVKGNTVVLSGPVDLPDGAEVEVRPIAPAPETAEERAREEEFLRHLLASGRISSLPTGEPDPPGMDRTPIEVLSGPPVSQTIIQERR